MKIAKSVLRKLKTEEMGNLAKVVEELEVTGKLPMEGVVQLRAPAKWASENRGYSKMNKKKTVKADVQSLSLICGTGTKNVPAVYEIVKAKKIKEQRIAAFQLAADNGFQENFNFWAQAGEIKNLPYAAGVEGSVFDRDKKALETLNPMLEQVCGKMQGITTPFLYIGRQGTTFGHHREDYDLLSINYLHHGANKIWIVIPPMYGPKLDALAIKLLAKRCNYCSRGKPDDELDFGRCDLPLRHKSLLFSPEILDANGIPYYKIVQKPGDFVIVSAGAYHGGFNEGFNIAEAINFATIPWIEIAKSSLPCCCKFDSQSWDYISKKTFERVLTVKFENVVKMQKKMNKLQKLVANTEVIPAATTTDAFTMTDAGTDVEIQTEPDTASVEIQTEPDTASVGNQTEPDTTAPPRKDAFSTSADLPAEDKPDATTTKDIAAATTTKSVTKKRPHVKKPNEETNKRQCVKEAKSEAIAAATTTKAAAATATKAATKKRDYRNKKNIPTAAETANTLHECKLCDFACKGLGPFLFHCRDNHDNAFALKK